MEETAKPSVSTRSAGVRYGLIMAVISIAYFVILTVASVDMTSGIGRWSSSIFYIGVIYLAHKYFKDNGDGFMSYGQGMGVAFWLSLVCTVIYSVFFYIYVKFIDSSFIQAIKDKQMSEMEGRGMSEEQIDQAMKMAGAFMSPEAMFGFSIVGGIIFMMFIALIVTIFTQKKDAEALA
jgi:hypothetical protein